jgi:thiamine-phosphate pyrophosphorylase
MLGKLSGLYAITDEKLTPDSMVVAQVQTALEEGVSIIQYRNKTANDDAIEAVCRDLLDLCHRFGALFIINDRPKLAQKIGADGVHIGRDDLLLNEVKQIFTNGIIGVSCYGSVRRAKSMEKEGASYVAFGSFFPSPTKPNSGIVSLSVLEKAKKELTIPVCAIGGINADNIAQIAQKGPAMISVVSAIFDGNIKENIRELKGGYNEH